MNTVTERGAAAHPLSSEALPSIARNISILNNGDSRLTPPAVVPAPAELRQLEARMYERREAAVNDLREFFAEASTRLVTLTLEVNVLDLLMVQRALKHYLNDWTVVAERRYDPDEAVLVKRLAIEVAPGEFDFVIRFGRQFWRSDTGEGLVVDIWASDDRAVQESEITFTLPTDRHEWLQQLLPQLKSWADKNHFLRNKPISADGKFVEFAEQVRWEDIILEPELRRILERNTVDLLSYAPLYRANGVPLRRGIILHGPPGTGKTMIGRALAQRCGVTFVLVTPGMLREPAHIKQVFDWGRRFAPAILFFEDFDLVAGSRHGSSRNELLGEFLSRLDGLDSHEGVIAIATTNDLKAIEPALKDRPNRFDCVLEVPAPGVNERRLFLERWLNGHPTEEALDVEKLVDDTDGFTGAQMQELCRVAVFEAVEERVKCGSVDPVRVGLSDAHFRAAMKRMGVRRRKRIGFQTRE